MNTKDRRETKNFEDRRKGPESHPYDAARQDNTFIRNEGLDAVKNIVDRNREHQRRLAVDEISKRMNERAERAKYEPIKPTYEPVPDTKESLQRMAQPDVFSRGRYRKSVDARPPYKRNNNK